MVERSSGLDAVFQSLANETRRDMLHRLMPREATVSELAAHYNLTFAAVSKHLQVLERARLIRKRRSGREQRIALSNQGMREAHGYIEQYRILWESRLDRLQVYLKDKQ